MTPGPGFTRQLLGAGALGVVLAPLALFGLFPSLPSALEPVDGFHWVAVAPAGTDAGHPLLLRAQADGNAIVAGSDLPGFARGTALSCHRGPIDSLREAARTRGRIEELTLESGTLERLTLHVDDLGSPATSYLYRCGPRGALPLLSWGLLPGFGVRSLLLAWLLCTAVGTALLGAIARLRRRRPEER